MRERFKWYLHPLSVVVRRHIVLKYDFLFFHTDLFTRGITVPKHRLSLETNKNVLPGKLIKIESVQWRQTNEPNFSTWFVSSDLNTHNTISSKSFRRLNNHTNVLTFYLFVTNFDISTRKIIVRTIYPVKCNVRMCK